MEDKKVTLKLENVSKVFAKVESDDPPLLNTI